MHKIEKNKSLSITRTVVQIGPDPYAQGGIAAVIGGYQAHRAGFEKLGYSMVFISSGAGADHGAILRFFAAWFRLIWLSICHNVHLVQIHTSVKGSLLRKSAFAATCLALRRPYVMHVHSGAFIPYYQALPRALRVLVRWIFSRAACVICLSEHVRQQFGLTGLVAAEKCRLIYNGIEDPLANRDEVPLTPQKKACSSSGKLTITFLGKLIEAKGLPTLLEALAGLPASAFEYTLLVGGNGDIAAFSEQVKGYGLGERVTCLGWVSGERKATLLSESTIFVLPSRSEGFPVALVEAMAFGVAVLSTRIPGVVDAVRDGTDGLLVEPDDPDALRRALMMLLRDTELRERLGASARQRFLDHFTILQISHRLAAIYDGVR
ncbi:glycosyltransferase family 4 protein [Paraburkholderia fungorum]|jgi:glycosyltransferase involved in cell wall biosynthesis|uniref:Glycosyltransferase involved in cell wall biosynthesis n=1 Tax=Paraburkholderia fungorum TaxID=134537 RepID=A0AAW3UMP0_9BURK|nr:glycosyltransferase family 4 protein [Paraburkholderia fungorum]MBB4511988.1 glycosyltransferase involved in cell wall biosynthesis [Paraburkholderia fungorum]MBB6199894.1 glycosyltransferase involved in cell wall biosynthesis [Paraburkholderia fungorum]